MTLLSHLEGIIDNLENTIKQKNVIIEQLKKDLSKQLNNQNDKKD